MTLLTARRVTVRPDFLAAMMLVLGGGAALIGVLLPWLTGRQISSSTSGWTYVRLGLSSGAGGDTAQRVSAYGVLGIAVAGGACILLGLATLLPITHQPLGAISLMLGLAVIGAVLWWTQENQRSAGGLGELFDSLGAGWFVAAVGGPLILIGAIRALSRSD